MRTVDVKVPEQPDHQTRPVHVQTPEIAHEQHRFPVTLICSGLPTHGQYFGHDLKNVCSLAQNSVTTRKRVDQYGY
jgi:hypothetical protein